MKQMNLWKLVAVTGTIGAVLCLVVGGLRHGINSPMLVLYGVFGASVGVIMAFELEKPKPKHAAIWETVAGAIGGSVLAAAIQPSAQSAVIGLTLGGLLGFLTPLWIEHIQLP